MTEQQQKADEAGNPRLIEAIAASMRRSSDGLLDFRDFMDMCLYHEDVGYYMTEREKIGRSGDFYTSAALGGWLAQCVVQYVLKVGKPSRFVEWGGGTGRFAAQFLHALRERDESYFARIDYVMIERSGAHCARQRATLEEASAANQEGDELLQRVRWQTADEWLASGPHADTFVFSNELLDAFAVHRLTMSEQTLCKRMVARSHDESTWQEVLQPLYAQEVNQVLDRQLDQYVRHYYPQLLPGQTVEVNLQALHWLSQVAATLQSGYVMTIDYGDTSAELSAPHRMNGTLLCYYRHLAGETPFVRIGEQDMTAHVNFSALQETGERCGLTTVCYMTQRQFLSEQGLLQQLQDTIDIRDPFHPIARRNRQIRQLLVSDGMSELFKVLVQHKKTISADD